MTSASCVSAFGKCDSVIRPSVRTSGGIIFESSIASAFSTSSLSGSINWRHNFKLSKCVLCRREFFFVPVHCLHKKLYDSVSGKCLVFIDYIS